MEATKNICYVKGESAVDHSTIIREFKKFPSYCKNLSDQANSDRPKKVMLQTIEENPVSTTRRVSGELGISQSNVIYFLHYFSKSIRSC